MEELKEKARAVQVDEAAKWLGISLKRDGQHELRGRCPRCGGAMNLRPDKGRSGIWYCWSARCGGDAIALVCHARGVGFIEAVRWLAK